MSKTFEDVQALGLEMVPEKPLTINLFGIDNLNTITDLLLDIIIYAIKKEGILGYLKLLPEIFPAIGAVKLIGNEVLDLTQDEWLNFVAKVETKLTKELTDFNITEVVKLAEDIAYNLIGIGISIYKLLTLKKSNV